MIRDDSSVMVLQDDLVYCNLDEGEGTVLLNLKDGEYHQLNAVASSIWHLAQEPQTVGAIRSLIMEQYEVDEEECRLDLYEILNNFVAKGIIAIDENGVLA